MTRTPKVLKDTDLLKPHLASLMQCSSLNPKILTYLTLGKAKFFTTKTKTKDAISGKSGDRETRWQTYQRLLYTLSRIASSNLLGVSRKN